jgi:uncharacterized protein
MKTINLSNKKIFVINNNTGRWGITKEETVNELKIELKKPVIEKKYDGTDLLVLNSSNECNLNCIYCSEVEHRYSHSRMSEEIAYQTVERALNEEKVPSIIFHGSEPTRNFPWIKKIVKYGYKRMNETGRVINFAIQSNLAELPKGFLDFIAEYHVGVSTSLDGTTEIHNKTRPYLDGRPSFEDVLKNAKKIIKLQGSLNVATVITKFNVRSLESILTLFENEGITSWQTIPAEGNSEIAPNPVQLGESYISLFNKVFNQIEKGEQKMEVRTISQYLASLFVHNGINACRLCSSGNIQPLLAVDYDGNVYPCDYFWKDKNLAIGNIKKQSVKSMLNSQGNLRMRDINKTGCFDCTWKSNCGGGCLASNYYSGKAKSPYCKTHKIVYNNLAKQMPELIERNLIKPILLWSVK